MSDLNRTDTPIMKPTTESKDDIRNSDYLMDIGNLSLYEIVGQNAAVKELKNLVSSIKYRDIYNTWRLSSPKGILLVGPTGVGKTASVKAMAKELDDSVVLMELRYLDIASKWVDMPIEHLRNFFNAAEEYSKTKHVIIFIDEIDAMIPNREAQLHETSMKRVNIFLEWMDGGFTSTRNITVIGATNYIDGVDKAARRPGRFDKIVEYIALDTDAIIEGLKIHLGKRNLPSTQLQKIDWNQVRPSIEDKQFSGADLPEIINRLINKKVEEHIAILTKKVDLDNLIEDARQAFLLDSSFFPKAIKTKDIIKLIEEMTTTNKQQNKKLYSGTSMGFTMQEN